MELLLIHTGGTIGMAETPAGLAPKAGLVEAAIAERLPEHVTLRTQVFAPLLDSADVGPTHWNAMLDAISSHPQASVIITHGTDTMAFTGAALSQALAGENRKVVLCGSMVPLGQEGDADGNLDLAIATALEADPGVHLAFAYKVMEAAGLVKHNSHEADAFRAQPQDPLSAPRRRRFEEKKLAILTLSPGMPADGIEAILSKLDGAVLRLFGSGTAMDDSALISVLAEAVAAGKRIRGVSQCEAGGLMPGSYAAGAGLWGAGVENGGKQTPEAALIHLWLN